MFKCSNFIVVLLIQNKVKFENMYVLEVSPSNLKFFARLAHLYSTPGPHLMLFLGLGKISIK